MKERNGKVYLTAHDRDKARAFLKSLAAECETDDDVHRWRECRHCLAVAALDSAGIRSLLRAYLSEVSHG